MAITAAHITGKVLVQLEDEDPVEVATITIPIRLAYEPSGHHKPNDRTTEG